MSKLESKIPAGPLAEKWTNYKATQKLVNPANKRRLDVIVVGTGLAGGAAAATLGELGFNVINFFPDLNLLFQFFFKFVIIFFGYCSTLFKCIEFLQIIKRICIPFCFLLVKSFFNSVICPPSKYRHCS